MYSKATKNFSGFIRSGRLYKLRFRIFGQNRPNKSIPGRTWTNASENYMNTIFEPQTFETLEDHTLILLLIYQGGL